MSPTTYRARWVFPVATPPIRDGIIVVREGRIESVGPAPLGRSGAEFADVAILPALVNAHTHLMFSGLNQPLGVPGMAFPDWIRQVVAWHRSRLERNQPELTLEAVRQGAQESRNCGVGTLGEIAGSPTFRTLLEGTDVSGVAFLELIGLSATKRDGLLTAAREYVSQSSANCRVLAGISPHAPYTVHPDLLSGVAQLSADHRFPVAMHLAESEQELQLLRDQSGPFVSLLQDLEAWDADALRRGSRPLDYLRALSQANRSLVIHGNFLDPEEIDFLGAHHSAMSIVYCPRTHAYFGHPTYPIVDLLAAGARVAIGTDSLASNPNLNLWEEMRFAAARHLEVSAESWLRIATLNGAEALGLGSQCGSLEPGKVANFLVVRLPAEFSKNKNKNKNPWDWIQDQSSSVERVYLRGELVWEADSVGGG